jgi:hypothetical protein
MITFNPFAVSATITDALTTGVARPIVGVYHDGVEQRLYANRKRGQVSVLAQGALGSVFGIASRYTTAAVDVWDGALSLWAMFATVWTDAEAGALEENPWQIFRPRREVLYFGTGTPAPSFVSGNYWLHQFRKGLF